MLHCTVRHLAGDNAGEVAFCAFQISGRDDLRELVHDVALGRVAAQEVVVVVEFVLVTVVDSVVPQAQHDVVRVKAFLTSNKKSVIKALLTAKASAMPAGESLTMSPLIETYRISRRGANRPFLKTTGHLITI